MNRRLPRGVAKRLRPSGSTGSERMKSGILSRCFSENDPKRSAISSEEG